MFTNRDDSKFGTNLAAAMFAVQQKVREVKKSSTARFGKYANLSTVIDALRPALDEQRLLVIQSPSQGTNLGEIGLTTTVVHVPSGEYLTDMATIPTAAQGIKDYEQVTFSPQGFGAAMTYARRYALVSIFGLKSEEDDATDPDADSGSAERKPQGKRLFARK